jgi:hypothetical protein
MPWRTAGIGLTSLATPIGIGVADPILGSIAFVIELAVAVTIIGTALFGSQALSDRAFRLLRWIANRPEPPAPGGSGSSPDANRGQVLDAMSIPSAQTTPDIRADNFGD